MLMVLNVHSFVAPSSLSFSTLTIGTSLDFLREASSISCVNLFILISGYFSIRWKLKSFLSLIFQIYFFVFIIYGILLYAGIINFDFKTLIVRANCISTAYWFIRVYLVLYLLSPILNAFVEKITEKQFLFFIIVFYLTQFYFQLFFSEIFNSGYSVLSFCGLYLLGRYIAIIKFDLSKKVAIFLTLGLTIIIAIIVIIISAVFNLDSLGVMQNIIFGFIYNNPLIVLQSVCIFMIFKKITINNTFINYCGSSALAVYLLHMHPDIKNIYYNYTQTLYSKPILVHIISLIFLFILTFVVSVLLDKIRIRLFERSYERIKQIIDKKCIVQ